MTYYYEFADGYICYTSGKMTRSDVAWETRKHGKLIIEKRM